MTLWRCGKCEGLAVPEHHRTCPLRTTPPPAGSVIRVPVRPDQQQALIDLVRKGMDTHGEKETEG